LSATRVTSGGKDFKRLVSWASWATRPAFVMAGTRVATIHTSITTESGPPGGGANVRYGRVDNFPRLSLLQPEAAVGPRGDGSSGTGECCQARRQQAYGYARQGYSSQLSTH
jgi:hypothetical protein